MLRFFVFHGKKDGPLGQTAKVHSIFRKSPF